MEKEKVIVGKEIGEGEMERREKNKKGKREGWEGRQSGCVCVCVCVCACVRET